jgi:hypothetical protein
MQVACTYSFRFVLEVISILRVHYHLYAGSFSEFLILVSSIEIFLFSINAIEGGIGPKIHYIGDRYF